eukprot:jgi/Galph1/534/GphlegSOOS_G5222.1
MGGGHSRPAAEVSNSIKTSDSLTETSKVASVLGSSLEQDSSKTLDRYRQSFRESEDFRGSAASYDTKPIPIAGRQGDSSTVVLTDEEAKSPPVSPPSPNLTPRSFLGQRRSKSPVDASDKEDEYTDDELEGTVPTAFDWRHGGMQVYVMGAFDNWQTMYPLHRSGNNFYTLLNLEPGVYQYKYYVDNEWLLLRRYAPELTVAHDGKVSILNLEHLLLFMTIIGMGNTNNIVHVKTFKSEFEDDEAMLEAYQKGNAEIAFLRDNQSKTPLNDYGEEWPDFQSFSKEPPVCPPQLTDTCCVLNSASQPYVSAGEESTELKRPLTVTVNHLYRYTESTGDHLPFRCYASTVRYRTKFVTVIYYKKA